MMLRNDSPSAQVYSGLGPRGTEPREEAFRQDAPTGNPGLPAEGAVEGERDYGLSAHAVRLGVHRHPGKKWLGR